ncbi:aminotransferase class I/II-fold pyridoxal phosphate-dependent enzyme [Peptococcaceae bacterium 1198_IL3148]
MSKNTPIINALKKYIDEAVIRFHMPGHKGTAFSTQALVELLGSRVFQVDVTNVPGMDDLHQVHGIIKESQQLAAQTYGADNTYFLVNGSSSGLQALIMATCNPGDKILVPRNMHRSILSGIILSGAIPVFYLPEYNNDYKLLLGTPPETIKHYLNQVPDIKAIMLVNPTYYGITSDIGAIAEIAHTYNVPLLIDEAHGPHLAFHQELPGSSLTYGADATVHGSHKILPAFTQASMLHLKGQRVNHERVEAALRILQSTSTSYLLLASLEGARAFMEELGQAVLQDALDKASYVRQAVNKIDGYTSFGQEIIGKPSVFGLDLTKVTINVTNLGISGTWAESFLRKEHNIQVEMSDLYNLLLIVGAANTYQQLDHFINALKDMANHRPDYSKTIALINSINAVCNLPELVISPREAFAAPKVAIPLEQSAGRISSEIVACYPPGIPIICPGEEITDEIINYLVAMREVGVHFQGCNDPSLQTIGVISMAV